MKYLLSSLICLFLFACGTKEPYDNQLKLIPRDQIVKRVKQDRFDYRHAKFKNTDGSELSAKQQKLLNAGELGKDYYEDAAGVVREVLVRPVEIEDKLIDIQRREIATKPLSSIPIIDVDCDNRDALFAEMDSTDQAVRKNRGDIATVDTRNLHRLVSILKKCGWNTTYMKTTWMILQHAPPEVLSYYYEDLLIFAKRKNLSQRSIAMLQDQMLARHGYKQLYGTQLFSGQLYKLEDPDQVNERRKAMGMGPLEDFLKIWGLDLEAEKERLRKEEKES